MERFGSGAVRVGVREAVAWQAECRTIRELVSGAVTGSQGVTLRVVEIEPLARCGARTAHAHARMEEVIFVLDGRGEVWVEGEIIPIAAGDALVIPAGRRHMTVNRYSGPLRLACFFPHRDAGDGWQSFPEIAFPADVPPPGDGGTRVPDRGEV